MFSLNVNGNDEFAKLLGELFSSSKRLEAVRKKKLENVQLQAEIQHTNAQTNSEIVAINVETAKSELLHAQAEKTEAEAYRINSQTVRENIVFALEIIEKFQSILNKTEIDKLLFDLIRSVNET